MKKLFLASSFCFAFLFFPQISLAEKIDDFQVDIRVNKDASIDVSESILYNFEGAERHGIFRDIPVKYQARGGNFNLRISDISVADEKGNAYNFSLANVGANKQIKIGDANLLVSGKKNYIINYKIKRAINYFDTFDELYWNGIGTQWTIPINNPAVKLTLPKNVSQDSLQISCYVGVSGSAEKCDSSLDEKQNSILFTSQDLAPGEGLTFAVGFPKGIVSQPTTMENILEIIKDNWILVLPVIVFVIMFRLWWLRGRDPQGRGTIIAQFDAPDNLTPLEIGIIVDERSDSADISAQIVHLATKGYLKIKRVENKILFFTSSDYELEKLKKIDDTLKSFERKLMQGLFGDGATVKISELRNVFYKDVKKINDDVYQELTDLGYFLSNPDSVRKKFIVIGIILAVSGFFVAGFVGGLYIFSTIVSGLLVIIFGSLMPARTKKGVEAREYILGLKEYLRVAEKDRIDFHNAPEKTPDHFEKLLPYAMALGVEKEWAKQFEGIYNQNPSWYVGPVGTNFNPTTFASDMHAFSAATAASGGSGSSGGGASGGGGGGGGGGSW
jgi:uncharacterized membrane protein